MKSCCVIYSIAFDMALMLLQLGVPVLCALSLSGGVSDTVMVILFPVICALSSSGGGGYGNAMVILFPVIMCFELIRWC